MYTHTCVYTYICIYIHTHISNMYIHTYVYTNIDPSQILPEVLEYRLGYHACVHVYVYMYTHRNVCIHVHKHTQITTHLVFCEKILSTGWRRLIGSLIFIGHFRKSDLYVGICIHIYVCANIYIHI